MEWMDRTAVQVRDAMANGDVRCAELVEQWIDRTQAAEALNGYVQFDAQGLRRQARDADARLASGQRLPLLGVPVALKDNIQAAGLVCGAGTPALGGRSASQDAELVRRLRAAGALIPGKLGMHELAFGITSNNGSTGAIRNPWDAGRIPGGSSGGSGAAVAARLVPASIGTDTGGSVRIPAALCGVAGFRPSVGRVCGQGMVPIASTRDTAGPLARSVADLALLDSVLTGDWQRLDEIPLRGLKLGIPQDLFWSDLDPGVEQCAQQALALLRQAGVQLLPMALPGIAQLDADVGWGLTMFEFARDMRHYLAEQVPDLGFAQLVHGIASPDVAALVSPLLGEGAVPEAAYRQALDHRARLQALYRDAFEASGVQALVFPTTPCTASRIGDDASFLHNGRACPTFATFTRQTGPGSNAALPGLSLPIGLSRGLPVGLALDGPAGSDRRLLAVGAAIEAVLPAMPAPPWR